MTSHQSSPNFISALFKGAMPIARFITGGLSVIQILYGLGWCWVSTLPKHEPRMKILLGSELFVSASPAVPSTAWLFAPDAQWILIVAGFLIVSVVAYVGLGVFFLAWSGGWRNPRMEPLRLWMDS